MSRADGRCAFCGADLEDCRCGASRAACGSKASRQRYDGMYRRAAAPSAEDMRAYALELAMQRPEVVAMEAAREEAAVEYEAAAERLEAEAAGLQAALEAECGPAIAAVALRMLQQGRSRAEVALAIAAMMQPPAVEPQVAEVVESPVLPSRRSRKARVRRPVFGGLLVGVGQAAVVAAARVVLALAALAGTVAGLAMFVGELGMRNVRRQVGGCGRHGRSSVAARAVRWVYLALAEPVEDGITGGQWGWAA